MTETITAKEWRRRSGGARAQRNGSGFENVFEGQAARSGITCVRFPNGCRTVRGPGGRPRLLPVKTPFDWILSRPGGLSGFFDTKSTSATTFCYSDVTTHQARVLAALEKNGHRAGYVVYFQRCAGVVVFFAAHALLGMRPRESLRPEQGLVLGSLLDMDLGLLLPAESASVPVKLAFGSSSLE